jgi:hypothetical protein
MYEIEMNRMNTDLICTQNLDSAEHNLTSSKTNL